MTTVSVGDKAPNFNLETDGGGKVKLGDFKGQKLVLYFYPKDDTPGCTTQAIDFTERQKDFTKAGTVVVGVSKDSVTKHDKFKAKHNLGIILASDPEGKVIQTYGSWIEKSMYGRNYMGIDRSTFLIDEKGVTREVWRKVRVKGHVGQVLDAVKSL